MIIGMTTEDYVAAELTAISPAPFAFQLLLPGSWEVKQVNEQPLTVDSPTIIAVFEPPQATNISVQVIGILLNNEISAAHWLEYYCSLSSWHVDTLQPIDARRARASCFVRAEGHELRGLVTVTVNGNTLILIQAFVPSSEFAALSDVVNMAVRSFRTEQVRQPNVIEDWSNFSLFQDIGFFFPASWHVNQPQSGLADRMAIDFARTGSNGEILGFARLKAISAQQPVDLVQELSKTRREFEGSDIIFDAGATSKAVTLDPPFIEATEVTVGARTSESDDPLEFTALAMKTPSHVIISSILGPSRKTSFYNWAVNMRAHEIANASLQFKSQS